MTKHDTKLDGFQVEAIISQYQKLTACFVPAPTIEDILVNPVMGIELCAAIRMETQRMSLSAFATDNMSTEAILRTLLNARKRGDVRMKVRNNKKQGSPNEDRPRVPRGPGNGAP